MTLTDRLGTLRFYQLQGEPYVQIVREAIKPAAGLTFVANYLGASPVHAVAFGASVMALLLALAIGFGFMVTRYHVYRAQVQAEWAANPITSRQLDLLERIELNTRGA